MMQIRDSEAGVGPTTTRNSKRRIAEVDNALIISYVCAQFLTHSFLDRSCFLPLTSCHDSRQTPPDCRYGVSWTGGITQKHIFPQRSLHHVLGACSQAALNSRCAGEFSAVTALNSRV